MVVTIHGGVRRPTTDPTRMPVGSVLVHPDGDFLAAATCRLVKVQTTHPGEWPWRRLTGIAAHVPQQGDDLTAWRPQPVGDVALLLGHATVLTGHEVGG